MTDEQEKALRTASGILCGMGYYDQAETINGMLAAGASDGQAEPIYQLRMRLTGDWRDQDEFSYRNNVKTCPDDVRVLYTHTSAEIAALREQISQSAKIIASLAERIAGMEKDAEKRRDALIEALAAVAVEYVADRHLGHYSRQWEVVVAKEKQS